MNNAESIKLEVQARLAEGGRFDSVDVLAVRGALTVFAWDRIARGPVTLEGVPADADAAEVAGRFVGHLVEIGGR